MNTNLSDFLEEKKTELRVNGEIVLQCKVKPNKKLTCFSDLLLDQKTVSISISKPPIDGKANKELISFLSDYFSVAKSFISIKVGKTSGIKLVKITN